jgi:hypothetical protein
MGMRSTKFGRLKCRSKYYVQSQLVFRFSAHVYKAHVWFARHFARSTCTEVVKGDFDTDSILSTWPS